MVARKTFVAEFKSLQSKNQLMKLLATTNDGPMSFEYALSDDSKSVLHIEKGALFIDHICIRLDKHDVHHHTIHAVLAPTRVETDKGTTIALYSEADHSFLESLVWRQSKAS